MSNPECNCTTEGNFSEFLKWFETGQMTRNWANWRPTSKPWYDTKQSPNATNWGSLFRWNIVLCNSKTEILFTQSNYLEYALQNWAINCNTLYLDCFVSLFDILAWEFVTQSCLKPQNPCSNHEIHVLFEHGFYLKRPKLGPGLYAYVTLESVAAVNDHFTYAFVPENVARANMTLWRRNAVRKCDADDILFWEIKCKKMDN